MAANPEFEPISVPRKLSMRNKLRRLARLIAKSTGQARVTMYDALNIAVTEAIDKRKAGDA